MRRHMLLTYMPLAAVLDHHTCSFVSIWRMDESLARPNTALHASALTRSAAAGARCWRLCRDSREAHVLMM